MSKLFWTLLSASTLCALAFFASMPLPAELSFQVALASIAVMLVLALLPGPVWRTAFVTLASFIVIRYLIWRFASLPLDDGTISAIAASLLLAAECYGISQLLLGMFVNVYPLDRKVVELPEDESLWPTVDIYIPTYSEPVDIVAATMMGALQIDYPTSKFNVYVCDDGFPRSLTATGELALELSERAKALKALCLRHGATYITREDNQHAKSGNLNNAMKHSNGQFMLVLDADHVPTRDFLKSTMGLFINNDKLAFVQTPHFFLNPDPVEKNLNLQNKMPAENDMFYRVVQKGLDLWNTSFFCGSAAVIRRKAILDIGGFSVTSITEDASTSVILHSKGWKSAYLGKPMIAGLQPESFGAFITQRLRWAMGMVQIFILQNPLLIPGLSLAQRLSYLSVISFWLFPFARIIFFIAPLLSIVFDLQLYPNSMDLFVSYTTPYMVIVVLTFQKMFGRVRRFLISELYETIQGFFALPAIISTIISPNKPTFKVTPKGERHDIEHVSTLAGPFYAVYALTVAALGYGIYRLIAEPHNAAAISLSMGWLVFNLLLLNGALGVLVERVQRRSRPRVEIDEMVSLEIDGQVRSAVLVDANEVGVLLKIPEVSKVSKLRLQTRAGSIPCELLEYRWEAKDPSRHPMLFAPTTPQEERACVELSYGSSARWEKMWEQRENRRSTIVLFLGFVAIGFKTALLHYSVKLKIND